MPGGMLSSLDAAGDVRGGKGQPGKEGVHQGGLANSGGSCKGGGFALLQMLGNKGGKLGKPLPSS